MVRQTNKSLMKAKENLNNLLLSPFKITESGKLEIDGSHLELRVACEIFLLLTQNEVIIDWFQEAEVESKLIDILKSGFSLDYVTMDIITDILVWTTGKGQSQSAVLTLLLRDLMEQNTSRAVTMATLLSIKVPSLAKNTEADVISPVVFSCISQSQNQNKTEMTKSLSGCLQAIQAMEPSPSLLQLIVSLLQASTQSANQNLFDNRRLQQVCVKTACHLVTRWQQEEVGSLLGSDDLDSLFDFCVSLLLGPSLINTLMMEVMSCVSALLMTGASFSEGRLRDLEEAVRRRLCDTQWELRDSTLQLLTTLTLQHSTSIHSWLADCGFPRQTWLCISDRESYVRGSALGGLTALTKCRPLWRELTGTISEDEIFEKISVILSSDLEAFARRAAVTFLHVYWKSEMENKADCMTPVIDKVSVLMRSALHDMDWEVKLTALKYWEDYIDVSMRKWRDCTTCGSEGNKRLKSSSGDTQHCLRDAQRCLTALLRAGCSDILELISQEHDRTVQLEICKLCYKLKEVCKDLYQSMEDITPEMREFLQKLHAFDLDNLIQEFNKSIDQYVNPESLLDDLVTSLTFVEVIHEGHSVSEEEDEGGDYFVDCY